MKFYDVSEHLPESGRILYCYSAVHGNYYIAKFNPARGWITQNDEPMVMITHWLDYDLPLPYPILEESDYEIAKKYGIKPRPI